MKTHKKGLTMVELIVVIGLITILIVIVAPGFNGYTKMVKEQVCETNCRGLERMYISYLELEGLVHQENTFDSFLQKHNEKICTEHGVITYIDGRVKCSIHIENVDEEVPYI